MTNHIITILGIDPGFEKTGFCAINFDVEKTSISLNTFGLVVTSKKLADHERLVFLHDEFKKKIDEIKPDLVAYEVFYTPRNRRANVIVNQVTGAILSACHGIKVAGNGAQAVKIKVTGNHKADKDQIELSVRKILGLKKKIKPDHVSDAGAIALAALSDMDEFKNQNCYLLR